MIRNKVSSFDKYYKTQIADQFFIDLELNEEYSHKVRFILHNLFIFIYIKPF